MTVTIKPGDIVKTRGGRDVPIYAIDGKGEYPIHGALDGRIEAWAIDGKHIAGSKRECGHDLILPTPPAREPMRIWVNVYDGELAAHFDEKTAIKFKRIYASRTAVPFIEVVESDDGN